MDIQNFKFVQKGHMVARFDIHIPQWGDMVIKECTLFEKDRNRWIAPPTRSFDGPDGKKGYVSLVKFNEKAFNRLQTAALAKIDDFLTSRSKPVNGGEHGN